MITAPPYQPIDLPEYEGQASLQPCAERLELMLPWLPDKPGRMLDLGCHTGWFCRQFKKSGWETFGIDRSKDWIDLARRQDPNGFYITADVFAITFSHFDVALCLSVAMYLFDDVSRGWDLLGRVSEAAPLMFMDFGGMYASRLPFDEATAIDQMLENTRYRAGALLGRTAFEGRPFFMFAR